MLMLLYILKKPTILFWCTLLKKYKKKFNANNSTKSQLHHPPQDNSCSAHQQPSIIDIKMSNTLK
jgi:hypothetical protein